MTRLRGFAAGATGIVLLILTAPADAQGNLDAGKSPAQIFADTCAACHRNARELRRASAGFLRQHYTTGAEEASAMANYLAGLPGEAREPRGAQPKRPPAGIGQGPTDAPRQPPRQAVDQQPKATPPQPHAGQATPKGRRSATAAEARSAPTAVAAPVEDKPAAPAEPSPPPAPAKPALEPFDE